MNTKRILFIAATLTFLTACSLDDSPFENAGQRVPVTLASTTVAATETRASKDLNAWTFDSGESINVRISNMGAGEWTDYTFTTGDDGAMVAPDPAPYYPAGAQNIDIAAYYPATAGSSFTVATDQTADDSYKASDLMFASVTNQAKQASPVTLEFFHKMARIFVYVTAGEGVTSINSVSVLNVKPTVSFNPSTGEVGEASGTATSIAISTIGAAVFPAQTINGGLVSIVTDKGTATYSVKNMAFPAGEYFQLFIIVNSYAVGTTTDLTDAMANWNGWLYPTTRDRSPEGAEAVDLGHPTVKWANMNVGALAESEKGNLFAWGVTTPYYVEYDAYGNLLPYGQWIDGKTEYDWANYPMSQYSSSRYLTKYTFADGWTDGSWYKTSNTFIGDGKTSFADYDYADDPARQNWCGAWRTPTDAEWAWLRENCTWTWEHSGVIVTSKVPGYTDKSIFLPAVGDSSGSYWSSELSKGYSWCASTIEFSMYDHGERVDVDNYFDDRCNGLPVRPVIDKE